ncbi:NDP-hexose 2,3-dehydratase family protein [Adhaeribacter sp. BT258]|uniref:NDP-hexose 2,3-dehydratase family protein n=1 Tax=Adhaeribacter terrigena TaxID=2793070 RepID=A0ABS1BXU6_9BACT|nr:NDP-hexose 2,3-dehydratase family protein [Adhaeribacter terrigena]MBK0401722.1 NDP-hexose 2,3-dehydratase family protein [Adhaeribacter terrigena]
MDKRLINYNTKGRDQNTELAFLKSALTFQNPFNTTEQVLEWVQERNRQVHVNIERIPFDKMRNWSLDEKKEKLLHSSGSFFSIEGINVKTNWGLVPDWDQPIINQPEIGFLGIITKEVSGILYFLLQAKIEPGNVNNVQLSPTLQATKSNYTKVHKGKAPAYLEYFTNRTRSVVLLDQLQSEQGARFLKKRNRNIIIKINEEIEILDDFCWLTLGQIKDLMRFDNVVNMDTRTVVSGISFGNHSDETVNFFNLINDGVSGVGAQFLASDLNSEVSLYSFDEIIHWFTDLKVKYDLNIKSIPLNAVRDWLIEDNCIRHVDNKFFSVIGVHVEISSREVTNWDQPLVAPVQEGICAFIVKEIDGILHFLVQAKLESGNFDILEMAPTLQCLTGSYHNENSLQTLPYLDYVLNASSEEIIFDTLQSEEGGRFYREQNRNMVLLVGKNFSQEVPENYIWMTLNQLKIFIKFNNYLNIQARSLISAISYN